MHLLDLKNIFPSSKVVVVELIPRGDGRYLRTGEPGKGREEQAVSDENGGIHGAHNDSNERIVLEQRAEHARLQWHGGAQCKLVPTVWVCCAAGASPVTRIRESFDSRLLTQWLTRTRCWLFTITQS